MKEILALYNIKTVEFYDRRKVPHNFAFSEKMFKNNIFIEHYSSGAMDEEDEFEDEDTEDDAENPEHGSQLSVVMKHKEKYYQFLMYHSTYEIGLPVIVLQTIIFLVDLIEKIDPAQLVVHLFGISPDPLIPHEILDIEFRDAANAMLKLKIETIHNLIKEGKAGLN